jgi:hypothetical protein
MRLPAALRQMGQQDNAHFRSYHQVFNRALWSRYDRNHGLFGLLLRAFCPQEHRLIVAMDATRERRWGPHIDLIDRYDDAVRSTHQVT